MLNKLKSRKNWNYKILRYGQW